MANDVIVRMPPRLSPNSSRTNLSLFIKVALFYDLRTGEICGLMVEAHPRALYRFPANWGLVEPIIGNSRRGSERVNRLRASQAERKCVSCRFVFLEHFLFSVANQAIR